MLHDSYSMNNDGNYNEKKLLGSGGYVFAKLTDEEQNKSNLGVSEIFLGQVGRLNEDRFLRYSSAVIYRKSLTIYVNRCETVCELPKICLDKFSLVCE
jgi:hypothetical protein